MHCQLPTADCQLFLVLFAVLISSCAPRHIALPEGAAAPFPEFQAAFEEATTTCRAIRTLTAELRLRGRAGRERLRGTLVAGMAEPASVRLEALAPFGPPIFIFVAQDNRATLLLPRDDLAVRDAPPADVLDALAGLKLDPGDLRTAVTGCASSARMASSGRSYPNAWSVVEAGGASLYMKKVRGRWQTKAATTAGLLFAYSDWLNGIPRQVRVSSYASTGSGQGSPTSSRQGQATRDPEIELAIEVAELETNTTLDARAFQLDVPAQARTLTLEELRRLGPLTGR